MSQGVECYSCLPKTAWPPTSELETVAIVSATTSTVLDPDRLLQAVVDLTKERFGLYHAHIYLVNGQILNLAVGAGENACQGLRAQVAAVVGVETKGETAGGLGREQRGDIVKRCVNLLSRIIRRQVGTPNVHIAASRRPSGLRKTTITLNSLAHRTTWLRSDLLVGWAESSAVTLLNVASICSPA